MPESLFEQNVLVAETVKWVLGGSLMRLLNIVIHSPEISPYDTSKETHIPDELASLATYLFSLSDFCYCTIRLISEYSGCSLIQSLLVNFVELSTTKLFCITFN